MEKYRQVVKKNMLSIKGSTVVWMDSPGLVICNFVNETVPLDAVFGYFNEKLVVCILLSTHHLRIHDTIQGDAEDIMLITPITSLHFVDIFATLLLIGSDGIVYSLTYPTLCMNLIQLKHQEENSDDEGTAMTQNMGLSLPFINCSMDTLICSWNIATKSFSIWRIIRAVHPLHNDHFSNQSIKFKDNSSLLDESKLNHHPKNKRKSKSPRNSGAHSTHVKKENLLATILGLQEPRNSRAIGDSSYLPDDHGLHTEFELELLCTASVSNSTAISTLASNNAVCSFACDVNGDILLHILLDTTLTVYLVDTPQQHHIRLERLHMISTVTSYAHLSMPISEEGTDYYFNIPASLVMTGNGEMVVLMGSQRIECATSFQSVSTTSIDVFTISYVSSDACSNCAISSFGSLSRERYSCICMTVDSNNNSTEKRIVQVLPFLFECPPLVQECLVMFLEYLPSSLAVALLGIAKVGSGNVVLEILLTAAGASGNYRDFSYQLLGLNPPSVHQCPAGNLYNSVQKDESLVSFFPDMFDLCHSLLCDYLLRGDSSDASHNEDIMNLAKTLLCISLLYRTYYQVADSQSPFATLAVKFCDFYSGICGSTLNASTTPILPTDCIPTAFFTRCQDVPTVKYFLEFNMLQFLQQNQSGLFHVSDLFLKLTSGDYYTKKSCPHVRHCVLFFRELHDCLVKFSENLVRADSIIGNAFNFYLARIGQMGQLDDNRLLLQGLFLPHAVRRGVEMALSACEPEDSWVPALRNYARERAGTLLYHSPGVAYELDTASTDDEDLLQSGREVPPVPHSGEEDPDGFNEVEKVALRRFPDDLRVTEACRLLRSSKSLYLRLPRSADVDVNDPVAFRHKQQLKLLALCRRSLAVVIGRGMLSMGALKPLLAEILVIPPLCLKGRCPPNNTVVSLDVSSAPPELTLMPEFHNGVAAALRMHPRVEGAAKSAITRSWIMYNKANALGEDSVASASHAGVVLGLGLQGHLQSLSLADICDYLTLSHELTTMAVLIGVSATKLSSSDPLISRTLCLHLPTLLAPENLDFDVTPAVQAAALTGLGLLHCGTASRLMTEFLFAELSRPPSSESSDTRECCSLAAGAALGLVLLSKGKLGNEEMKGLADLQLEDRLHQYICGGRRLPESKLFPSSGSTSTNSNNKSIKIRATETINSDVVAPGAILALAFMYMQTGNVSVASRLLIPHSAYELDLVRPDILLFRAMGYCLVMWSNIEDTVLSSNDESAEKWVDQQIPAVVLKALFEETTLSHSNKFDAKAAFPCYLCIVTGYCFGLGLMFAGTSNARIKYMIYQKLKLLQSIRDTSHPQLSSGRFKSYRGTVEMCTSVVSVALASVMAGTGDLDCLRLFRELRWKHEEGAFGYHMSIGMAIGLLFLAGGRATLRRDPVSIAALAIASSPRYPLRTVDNQYHLQPLRHLYVLAVQWRAETSS